MVESRFQKEMKVNERTRMIVQQAKEKGWNNTDNWLFRKLQNEIAELDDSIQQGDSPEEIATEYIDIIYILDQILSNHIDDDLDMEFVFLKKFKANENTPKKTWEEGKGIVKK